jgi:hypothetical protein
MFSFLILMDLRISLDNYLDNDNLKIDNQKFQKMILLYNAIEEGWTIKKKKNSYVFTKNHENKREVFDDEYLKKFMKTNLDLVKILC